MMSVVRGLRGATTVEQDDAAAIVEATKELIVAMVQANDLQTEDIASCYITVTCDLTAAFPAKAVRELSGWDYVPLMCAVEMNVPGSLPRCIRILLHVNTIKSQTEMKHTYLRNATVLRPDLVQKQA